MIRVSSSLLLSACCVGFLGLVGCSSLGIDSKKIDYKSSASTPAPSLEVPPDLTTPQSDGRYAVPGSSRAGSATYSQYTGQRAVEQKEGVSSLGVLPKVEKVRIERAGTQRWLVVSLPPEKLWGEVKDFWQETGFLIKLERPEAGVMETDWAENRAKIGQDVIRNTLGRMLDSLYSTSERDMFRTRLEPGETPGTTDVFISHRGMSEIYVTEGRDQTRWQPRPADPDLEAEMLRRLMVRLGVEEKRAQDELAAQKALPPERAKLVNNGLQVDEPFDRAWRRVGLALDRVGFTVEDRDRSKGLYFVRYVDPEAVQKDEGWMSKLAFWRSSPPVQTRYQVLVKGTGEQVFVEVLSNEGLIDQSDTAKKILGLLRDQLK